MQLSCRPRRSRGAQEREAQAHQEMMKCERRNLPVFTCAPMAASESATPEVLDALPYIDRDLELYPNLKEKLDAEFAREPKPPSTLHPRVSPPIALFEVRWPKFRLKRLTASEKLGSCG